MSKYSMLLDKIWQFCFDGNCNILAKIELFHHRTCETWPCNHYLIDPLHSIQGQYRAYKKHVYKIRLYTVYTVYKMQVYTEYKAAYTELVLHRVDVLFFSNFHCHVKKNILFPCSLFPLSLYQFYKINYVTNTKI